MYSILFYSVISDGWSNQISSYLISSCLLVSYHTILMLRRAFLSYDSHIIFVYTISLQSNIFFVYALPLSLYPSLPLSLPPFFILLSFSIFLNLFDAFYLSSTLSLATFLQQPHMFVTLSFSLIIPFSSSPLPSLSLHFLTVFFNLCHHLSASLTSRILSFSIPLVFSSLTLSFYFLLVPFSPL